MTTPPKHILSAATIVLNDKKEILLLKGPKRGWEMPGGQVEVGESLKKAAIQETKEETGIDIKVIKFCGIVQNDFKQRIEYCLNEDLHPFYIEF